MSETESKSDTQNKSIIVQGQVLVRLPEDLYIPPDALEVFLETFEGPLDLLLYLIRKQNLDILNIPIAQITKQYMEYIDLMKEFKLELAAEYLVMAAMLAEIKSRMLLPRTEGQGEEDEEDPRAQLVRRLQNYERYRKASENIAALPQLNKDIFQTNVLFLNVNHKPKLPDVALDDLLRVFSEALKRAALYQHHHITRSGITVRERMTEVLTKIKADAFTEFEALFDPKEGRIGLVVTFVAILELIKESLIVVIQQQPYAPIHVKAAA